MQSFSKTLEHDLRSITRGNCFFDRPTLQQYASDACWYRITPLAVIQPRDAEDVAALIRYCYDRELPVIPRGAATGLAGQAIGMGVVLDFTRYMNAVGASTDLSVLVQPGVVLATLNDALRTQGRYFPVDPASASQCTMGGMIGTNAAGSHGVIHGSTKDHVQEMTVILSNGEQAVLKHPVQFDKSRNPFLGQIMDTVSPLLTENADLISKRFPRVRKNSSGYNLADAVGSADIDLRKLVIGSEGTLAIVVEALLNIQPLPRYRIGALAYLNTYEQAMDATILGLDLSPAAIELFDQTYVNLVRGLSPATDRLILDAKAMVYFEFEGESREDLQKSVVLLGRVLAPVLPLKYLPLTEDHELRTLWQLREEASRIMNSFKSKGKTSFIEDVAVPVLQLPKYIQGLKGILEQNGIDFCLYGHAGSGNIHCAAFVDLTNLRHYKVVDTVASEVYDLAISLGGTLSGEHGDGLVRTPFLERLYGSEVYELFRTVKSSFDPKNILNPGKIIGDQNTTILHDLDIP